MDTYFMYSIELNKLFSTVLIFVFTFAYSTVNTRVASEYYSFSKINSHLHIYLSVISVLISIVHFSTVFLYFNNEWTVQCKVPNSVIESQCPSVCMWVTHSFAGCGDLCLRNVFQILGCDDQIKKKCYDFVTNNLDWPPLPPYACHLCFNIT